MYAVRKAKNSQTPEAKGAMIRQFKSVKEAIAYCNNLVEKHGDLGYHVTCEYMYK